ncbi:hypothetical protein [Arhodomonas sp. SL1]|uniref:hypothetical protein n=1 Tax=Arhodomonas sp. SL1 TaxID=3425691 RepID=UPI003F882198
MAALLLLAVSCGAAADPRLEAPSFRNIDPVTFRFDYPALAALKLEGQVVPGLHRNFVPQGIDYVDRDNGRVVLSGYFCERVGRGLRWQMFIRRCMLKHSALYLYDLAAGETVRLAMLEERDGEPMRRHAGGVAVLHDWLWVPDRFQVFRFALDELLDAEVPVITMRPDNERPIPVDSSGDFVTAEGGMLWVGNFQRGDRGAPLPQHYLSLLGDTRGWTAGYRIDPETLRPVNRERYQLRWGGMSHEVYRPDIALHHRDRVQGISFLGTHRVVLSASWGRAPSSFAFHHLPSSVAEALEKPSPTVRLPDGTEIPVLTLFRPTREMRVHAPPGSEGISFDGRGLVTVFEGGAMPYRERWPDVEDRMIRFLPPGITRSVDQLAEAVPEEGSPSESGAIQ